MAIHLHKGRSGNYNPHAHILVFPRTTEGKKLRLRRTDLAEFHRKWQEELRKLGYEIRKDPNDEKLPHLGTRLYYDRDAQELYKTYYELKRTKADLESIHRSEETEEKEEGREIEEREYKGFWSKFQELFETEELKSFREKQIKNVAFHLKALGYSPSDRVAVVLINHEGGAPLQKVLTVRELLDEDFIRYLSAMNAKGYSVYMTVNVLKNTAKKRRKSDFKPKQRRIYLDLDSKNTSPKEIILKLFQYLRLKGLPPPTHITKTSKGNYQVYWVLSEEVEWELLEKVMRRMNNDLSIDHTQDVSRVFRVPYFRNRKPGKDDLVMNISELDVFNGDRKVGEIRATGKPVSFEAFRKLLEPVELPKPKRLAVEEHIDIGKEVEMFWKEWARRREEEKRRKLELQRREEERRCKERERQREENELELDQRLIGELTKKGYSYENAVYYAIFKHTYEKYRMDLDDFFERYNAYVLYDMFMLSFERNKGKTPSEVDMGLCGLTLSRYNGRIPDNIRQALVEFIAMMAVIRGKRADIDEAIEYAVMTLQTAERNYERIREELERPKQERKPFTLADILESEPEEPENDEDFGLSL